jgi:Inner membrane protein YgaP-like, transmembrane domain
MGFAKFMSSGLGRGLRIVVGLALMVIGLFSIGGTGGIILAVVGAVPLVAGVLDVCLFAPLFGGPLKGAEARAKAL